jgi:hypothetical protein
MGSAIPFIIWIFCIGVAALIIGKALGDDTPGIPLTLLEKKEGFVNLASVFRVTACPGGTTSYILSNGDTNCCSGDIVGNRCNGQDVCSLSPDPYDKNLDSCSAWLAREWARRAARFCPRSMYNYFGKMTRGGGSAEGCSASLPTSDGSQPSDETQPRCKIYQTLNDELSDVDSCYNMIALDKLVCPQANATKDISASTAPNGEKLPAILKCTYIPSNGSTFNSPIHCIDVPRYKTYIGMSIPSQWKELANELLDQFGRIDVNFCPASKAYYVDGTLSRKDARGLPGSGSGSEPDSGACGELRAAGLLNNKYPKTKQACGR